MAFTKIDKESDTFPGCYQSSGKVLAQSENPSLSWTFPYLPTMHTEILCSPSASCIHSDPRARELADVLERILKSPTQACTPPFDRFSSLSSSDDPSFLLSCYGDYFSPLADSQLQLDEYVHDVVPVLQSVGDIDKVDMGQRQEAIKLAADTILARRASGTGWSRALRHTLVATASGCPTEELGRSMAGGSFVSKQSLDRASSSKVSVCRDGEGIEDLLSGDSGTFSAFESLEVDSSSPGCIEIDTANAFSDGGMGDSTSELMYEDGVRASAEDLFPARLPLYASEVLSQNCVAGGFRDEPSSGFTSDSVMTPQSTNPMDLHQTANEMGELQKRASERCYVRPTATENEIQATIVSQGAGILPGTVLGHPCRGTLLQPLVEQNMAVLPGYVAISQAREAEIGSSSPLAISTNLYSVPLTQALLNAAASAAGDGGPRDATVGNCASMRELAYRVAAFQPVNWSKIEGIRKPKRRNVRISKDPQSIAARRRREKISDRIRILQRIVPGGTKMDTASMLDEAINYVKFLQVQVQALQRLENRRCDGMFSSHQLSNVCNRSSNNIFGSYDFPSDPSTEASPSGALINPDQLEFSAFSQSDFPAFFNPDQYLHQQPCH